MEGIAEVEIEMVRCLSCETYERTTRRSKVLASLRLPGQTICEECAEAASKRLRRHHCTRFRLDGETWKGSTTVHPEAVDRWIAEIIEAIGDRYNNRSAIWRAVTGIARG